MKFYAIKDPMYAQDIMLSLINQMPHNLIIRESEFEVLFRLGEGGLEKLCEEAKKKDPHRPMYLDLFTKLENSKECAHNFKYDTFNWDKVVKVDISGNSCDAWDNRLKDSFQYIAITFITKA